MKASSTSRIPRSAFIVPDHELSAIKGVVTPEIRLAPLPLWIIFFPARVRMLANKFAVVVFPFVPVIRIHPSLSCEANMERVWGDKVKPILPGMVEPPKLESLLKLRYILPRQRPGSTFRRSAKNKKYPPIFTL